MESPNQSTDLSLNENGDFKIYLISSSQTNRVYIGSTKQSLEQRFSRHKSHAKDTKIKCRSKVLINNFSDCKIDLIEYTTKEDRLQRERFWIEYYCDRAVNIQIPGRTMKEYRLQHAAQIKEQMKEYYQQHAEEIKEQKKEYGAVRIICECGTSYRRGDKTHHIRTKKHKDFITQQQTQQ
jgi:hypothetical protein